MSILLLKFKPDYAQYETLLSRCHNAFCAILTLEKSGYSQIMDKPGTLFPAEEILLVPVILELKKSLLVTSHSLLEAIGTVLTTLVLIIVHPHTLST